MPRRLVVFATEMEAAATLKAVNARPLSSTRWQAGDDLYVVTGIGMVTAAASISPWISQCDEVWNLGIAASVSDKYQLRDVVEVALIRRHLAFSPHVSDHYQQRAQSYHPPIEKSGHDGARLATCDWAIHHDQESAQLRAVADLVDMEGYGIAAVASAAGKPWHSIKAVSDFGQEGGSTLIKQLLPELSDRLAETIRCVWDCAAPMELNR